MKLHVLGSSSSGNCYILETLEEALIIEAGIKFVEVKKALKFNIRKVVGCLISHQHGDHSKYTKEMLECGFHTLALPEVFEAKKVDGIRAIRISGYGKGYKFGQFKVIPFPACHDVPCAGFLINHPESGLILFLTDSFMCEYTFPGLNHVMIECNYSDSKLIRNIEAGRVPAFQRTRLMTSHMELNTCKEILRNNDMSNVTNIILLHLSSHNSDEELFTSEIQRATGKSVYVANPGLSIELSKLL
jgi:phosphoribosyl 1,2-cyclic phosphodiesterase